VATPLAVERTRDGIYAGWRVLSGTFLCALLVIGSTNYAFQLFVLPVEQEFGLSRAAMNQGMSLFMIGCAVWAPIAGRVLDRVPAPFVMAAGGLLIGLAMATIAATESLGLIACALAGPLALGAMCAGGLANTTVVSRWFRRRRGRALGIATVSSGAGGVVMLPVISGLIESHGWRGALAWTGAILAIGIGLLAIALIRSRPSAELLEDVGEQEPVGALAGAGKGAPRAERSWSLGELLRSRNFWCITFGAGLLMSSDAAILISKAPYLAELGLERQDATFLLTCEALSAVVGKIGIGLAADRVDVRRLFAFVALCHVMLLVVMVSEPSYGVLLVAMSILGVGFGGVYPLLATMTASAFGSTSFGAVAGTMQLALHPVSILLLTFVGAAHDRTGSYTAAFLGFVGIVAVASAFVAAVKLPPRALAAPIGVPT